MKELEMVFWRDDDEGSGCLEYSWVPTGRRHHISLAGGIQEESETDSVEDGTEITNVQVYVATNDNEVNIEMWQFPAVGKLVIAKSRVEIFQRRREIVGTAYFVDGTVATYTEILQTGGKKCPTGLLND
jgi:hypothetical protein